MTKKKKFRVLQLDPHSPIYLLQKKNIFGIWVDVKRKVRFYTKMSEVPLIQTIEFIEKYSGLRKGDYFIGLYDPDARKDKDPTR